MHTQNIIERALELARGTGNVEDIRKTLRREGYSNVEDIRKTLRREGYSNVDAHLCGASIRAQLKRQFVG
jgi:hypothetical protein